MRFSSFKQAYVGIGGDSLVIPYFFELFELRRAKQFHYFLAVKKLIIVGLSTAYNLNCI